MTPVPTRQSFAAAVAAIALACAAAAFPLAVSGELGSGASIEPVEQDESGPFPKTGLFPVVASGKTTAAGTADDPAIWVHPTDPGLSVIIGANKNSNGGLHVFDLNGVQLQFVAGGKHNNVDVRYGFTLAGEQVDLVAVCDRNDNRIDVYRIDPGTQRLTQVGAIQTGIEVYGFTMYHSRLTDRFFGFVSSENRVEQWELVDAGGTVAGVRVRAWSLTSVAEGLVADDELGYLYLAEENRGIYRYGAEPGDPTGNRVTIDVVGSATQLVADVEGLTIYYRSNGLGYLIASSQGNNRYNVYRREGGNAYLGTFEIANGVFGSARDTDGIDVINANLGPLYPLGLFVAQNDDTDFKMVPWEDIASALGLAIHTTGYDVRGDSCSDVASVAVSPAQATVEVGATLQLSADPRSTDGSTIDCAVEWSADDETAAVVGSTGLVTGVTAGQTVEITAASGGATGSALVSVVPSTNQAPVVDAGADLSSTEGASVAILATFDDADAADLHTATIDWGDGSPVQAGTVSEAAGTIAGTHVYADDGAFTATVTVRDGRGGEAQDAAAVTVENVLPIAHAGGPYSGVAGVAIQFSGSATDPGADPLTYEWDFDYDGTTFSVEATGSLGQRAYATAGSYWAALRVSDGAGTSPPAVSVVTVADKPPVSLYFALESGATIGGVSVANEDIVAFDGSAFSLVFDGSDVGLSSASIDALAVIGPTQILLSFTEPRSVAGVSGTVDDSDVVRFTATSLGTTTAGSFAMYLDASDVGLSNSGEDLDAIELLPDGRLIVSTVGSFSVPGASGAAQDLVAFTPTSTGPTTAGSWALYIDGSDVSLSSSSENIDAVALDGSRVHLSTSGSFSALGVSGADEDVFIFTPTRLGTTTTGSIASPLFFDGSLRGVSGDIAAIDLP
jgi:3-phytase